jgi:hypothetical protein
MNKTRVLLTMIFWTLLVPGAGFGSPSGQAQAPTSAQSSENSANNSSANGSNDTPARSQNDETGEYINGKRQGFSTAKILKNRTTLSHTRPAPSPQLRSTKTMANHLRTETPRNVADSPQASRGLFSNIPGKTVRNSSSPVSPSPSTVALNGQHFKNSRDPGARLATTGGPTSPTRDTGAISGSAIKRKP